MPNPPSTNLLSTPYPDNGNNSMASRTIVPNNSIKADAETVVSDVQTSASENLEGPIVITGDSFIIPEKYLKKQ